MKRVKPFLRLSFLEFLLLAQMSLTAEWRWGKWLFVQCWQFQNTEAANVYADTASNGILVRYELRNNSCRPYFIVIQIWVGIIFMNMRDVILEYIYIRL
jgi:hypothetical protein